MSSKHSRCELCIVREITPAEVSSTMTLVRFSISLSGTSLLSAVGGFNTVTTPLNETEVVTQVHKQILSVYRDISKMMDDVVLRARLVLLLLMLVHALSTQDQSLGHVDPLTLSRADPRCWESASVLLLEMRTPRIAHTVPDFWDLMVFLKSSDNRKHGALFWDLAQVFWDLYVDCIRSRNHGLGRRHIMQTKRRLTVARSLSADKSFVQESQNHFSKLKEFTRAQFQIQVQQDGPRSLHSDAYPKTQASKKISHF